MPPTLEGLGYSIDQVIKNPELGVEAQAKYMRQLLDDPINKGRYDLALASYNAGIGTVQSYGGIPPFEETKNYVTDISSNSKFFGGNGLTTNIGTGANTPAGCSNSSNDTTVATGNGKCSFPSGVLPASERRKKLVRYLEDGRWSSQDPTDTSHILGTSSPTADQNIVDLLIALIESGITFRGGSGNFNHGSHLDGSAFDFVSFHEGRQWVDNTNEYTDQYTVSEASRSVHAKALSIMKATGVIHGNQLIGPDLAKSNGVVYLGNSDVPGHNDHIHVGVTFTSTAKVSCAEGGAVKNDTQTSSSSGTVTTPAKNN
jgi:hypothetical protein